MADRNGFNGKGILAAGLVLALLLPLAVADDAPAGSTVLHLSNQDRVFGRLLDSAATDRLFWQSPVFTRPFEFDLAAVGSIQFPLPKQLPNPEGESFIELVGGDLLFGALLSVEGDVALLDITGVGPLHIDRSAIVRLSRWTGGGGLIFLGPTGLAGWTVAGKAWREEAGRLMTDQKPAILRRDFKAPVTARFEWELSWSGKPDFELALGVDADPNSALRAFRIEVWDDQLVAFRETEREADVAPLMTATADGRLHIQAFVDQQSGRMLLMKPNGDRWAEVAATTGKPQVLGGVQLTNKSGSLRLDRLRISPWNGVAPDAANTGQARVHLSDGTIVYGEWTGYDATTNEYLVIADSVERRFPKDRVEDIVLTPVKTAPTGGLRVLHHNGLKVSGALWKVEAETLWLRSPFVREPLALPLHALQSVVSVAVSETPPSLPNRAGRLEAEQTVLRGCLVDAVDQDTSCLVWQPVGSHAASPLVRGVSAKIVYRDPPPPPKPVPPQEEQRMRVIRAQPAPGLLGQLQTLFGGDATMAAPAATTPGLAVLHLRSGDKVPCTVDHIDDKGLHFTSKVADASFVPHEQIKVLELMPNATAGKLPKSKRDRLLVLPRMQRDNPPTQLVRSVDGDYLRGRLASLNETELQLELRLDTRTIPRNRVVRIIWLHPDEFSVEAADPAEASTANVTRVQSLPSDGNRLTFHAQRVEGQTLSGASPLLGACRVDLNQIDQLLTGSSIDQAVATLAFHNWKLRHALDPLEQPDGDGGAEGTESLLVGKPAPDITLPLTSGKEFRLADHRGEIVILDFWASWCGPCLQVMPQVDRVAREFADDNVRLVAINLEESAERVKATLDRLKLETVVALDKNGRVAERYGASAIPQTVIIDRQGKVARLFVGGGARFDDQLREALRAVMLAEPLKSE